MEEHLEVSIMGPSTTTNGGGNDTNTAAAPATAAEIPTFTIP